MKRIRKFLIATLLLTMIVPVSGCGSSGNTGQFSTTEQSEEATTQKSENELTEREQRLLDALITMAKENCNDPAKVRILEIPVYYGNLFYDNGDDEDPPVNEYAVVRLQGTNQVGGNSNSYYVLGISEKKAWTKYADESYDKYWFTTDYCAFNLKAGECISLGDDYNTIETPYGEDVKIIWSEVEGSRYFDIGKINKAFAAYWKDMGFE